jgi:stage III sporulation protein SpoIIIAA
MKFFMSRVAIDGFDKLLEVLPFWMRQPVTEYADNLEEICLDKGKTFCLKLTDGFENFERVVEQDDLEHLMCEVGMARSDGRTGIDGTLHRVAAITNRYGAVTGYTIRIGRYLKQAAVPLRDLLFMPKASLALFGPPGSGKSTLIRSVTAMLAEEFGPRLCVVDSSNEIAGDGDTPHHLLKSGRRLQVPNPEQLAAKLIEGLINHGPAVMIVDELARPHEVSNIIRIIQRGVRVIACLHGDTIQEVVRNPDYEPLLGISIGQRLFPTIFSGAIELRERGMYWCYKSLSETVDAVLANQTPPFKRLPLDGLPVLRDNLLTANKTFPNKPVEEIVAGVFQDFFSVTPNDKHFELPTLCKQSLSFLEEVRYEGTHGS